SVPAEHRRGAAPLRARARARDEPRAAVEARARRVPRRRGRLQQGERPPAARRGGRGGDQGAGGRMSEGNGNGKLTTKDFKTDQEVRWCPGCSDYAILAA